MTFDLDHYLARIHHRPLPVSHEGLAALQRAHQHAIPFETIDVYLGHLPGTATGEVVQKLVLERRGGWCLEHGVLYGAALAALGYPARSVLGRVRMGAESGGPRSHLANVVAIGGAEYLSDTGFGGPGPAVPLRLDSDAEVATPDGTFRLRADSDTGERVLERRDGAGWFALWGFDMVPVTPPDILAAGVVCARWEGSPFPSHLMVHRFAPSGRVSLFDRRLTTSGGTTEIDGAEHLAQVLAEAFGLTLDRATCVALWSRLSANDAGRAAA